MKEMKPQNHHKLLIFSLVPHNPYKCHLCPNQFNKLTPLSPFPACAFTEPATGSLYKPASSPPQKLALPISPIKKICDSTDYPDICISTNTPFLNDKTYPISALEMTIKTSYEHMKLAISMASKITTNSETASQFASIVGDCKDSYIDALENLKEVMNVLPSRDFGTMNNMLSAAITDFRDCDDEFSGLNSPLLEFDAKLTKMTSNCLAFVSLIKCLWSFIVVEVYIGC